MVVVAVVAMVTIVIVLVVVVPLVVGVGVVVVVGRSSSGNSSGNHSRRRSSSSGSSSVCRGGSAVAVESEALGVVETVEGVVAVVAIAETVAVTVAVVEALEVVESVEYEVVVTVVAVVAVRRSSSSMSSWICTLISCWCRCNYRGCPYNLQAELHEAPGSHGGGPALSPGARECFKRWLWLGWQSVVKSSSAVSPNALGSLLCIARRIAAQRSSGRLCTSPPSPGKAQQRKVKNATEVAGLPELRGGVA